MRTHHRNAKERAALEQLQHMAAPGFEPTVCETPSCPSLKRRWPTRHRAELALLEIRTRRLKRGRGEHCGSLEVRAYECGRCGGYHLTSMSRREFAERVNHDVLSAR